MELSGGVRSHGSSPSSHPVRWNVPSPLLTAMQGEVCSE